MAIAAVLLALAPAALATGTAGQPATGVALRCALSVSNDGAVDWSVARGRDEVVMRGDFIAAHINGSWFVSGPTPHGAGSAGRKRLEHVATTTSTGVDAVLGDFSATVARWDAGGTPFVSTCKTYKSVAGGESGCVCPPRSCPHSRRPPRRLRTHVHAVALWRFLAHHARTCARVLRQHSAPNVLRDSKRRRHPRAFVCVL